MSSRNERVEEIEGAMTIIQKLCERTEIRLCAKEIKGKLGVVVQDARYDKEYVMYKNRSEE